MSSLTNRIIWPPPGHYVVAVSGGVDSMALLDLLAAGAKEHQLALTAAHFNHGWEGDDAYEETVRAALTRYDLPLEVGQGNTNRSEAAARAGRYGFLRELKDRLGVDVIITAHHLDDLEETVILNLQRGTGRRGLTPFMSVADVVRPLVNVRKSELKEYAQQRDLLWCHDSYNDDLKFARNQVRHEQLPESRKANSQFDREMSEILDEAATLNREIDDELGELFVVKGREAVVEVEVLRQLDLNVITELLVMMVNSICPGTELSKRTIEQLAVDLKTGRLNRPRDLKNGLSVAPARDTVTIVFRPL